MFRGDCVVVLYCHAVHWDEVNRGALRGVRPDVLIPMIHSEVTVSNTALVSHTLLCLRLKFYRGHGLRTLSARLLILFDYADDSNGRQMLSAVGV